MPLSHAGSIGPLPSCFNFGLKIHIMNDDLRDLTHYQHIENVERAAEDTVVNAQCGYAIVGKLLNILANVFLNFFTTVCSKLCFGTVARASL